MILLFGTGAAVESGEGQEDHPPADLCEGHVHRHHGGEFARLAHSVYAPKHWQTPRRLARRQGDVLAHKRHCAATLKIRAKMQRIQIRSKQRLYRHRHRMVLFARYTPYGAWAIPGWCVMAESGGSWSAHNPSSPARGPYQLLSHDEPWPVDSWKDKLEHHRIASELYAASGLSPWVACS